MITLGNPRTLPDIDAIDVIAYNRTKSANGRVDCWRIEVLIMAGTLQVGQVALAVKKGEVIEGASKDTVTRLAVDATATTLANRISTKDVIVDDAYASFESGMNGVGDVDDLIEAMMIAVGMIPSGLNPTVV